MTTTPTEVCPYGGVPKPDELHKSEWVALQYLPAGIVTMLTDGGLSWLATAISPILMNIDDLCANGGQIPVAFENTDWETKLIDIGKAAFPGAPFMGLLWEWAKYGAYLNFCQCLDQPPTSSAGSTATFPVCAPTTQDTRETAVQSFGTNLTTPTDITGLTSPGPLQACLLQWSNAVPLSGGHLSCVPRWRNAAGTDITPEPTHPSSFLLDGSNPCLLISFSIPTGAQFLQFQMVSTGVLNAGCIDSFGAVLGPNVSCTPPSNPPPAQIYGPPAAPPNACDSTSLCNVSWLINTFTTNNQNLATITNNQTTTNTTTLIDISNALGVNSYVLGSAHTLTGKGEQAVAAGTLGVLLNATVVPPWQSSESTEPTSYYDLGWIALGTPDGVYPKRWIRFNGEIMIPDFAEFTRFAYNCGDGVTLQATELVPPPPPP